ncbi:MAG: Na+:solute symporter [Planctomycetes bacterium]|nr:Na+:solute symporter [Planctomycetota bacterium]
MTPLDWTVLLVYFALLLGIGLLPSRKASAGAEDYFVSGRTLPWWMAGTSLIAASFASDTPLLVSGLVRSKGLWGNWLWWGFGISAVLTVFLFAPLWRSARVVTDVELTELRYSGDGAAVLRGVKSFYWGVLFNCFTAGAWAVTGLVKVTAALTGLGKTDSILLCAGVVAWHAVDAAGGLDAVTATLPAGHLQILPLEGIGFEYCLPFLAIQWWAWKNTDGSGVMVQRWASCRDERHAMGATLWYAVVHYGLRCWPWVLVGLASIVLVPASDLPRLANGSPDHEAAYPIVMARVIPAGLRGAVVAWFFAEFMSSIAQSMNWGGSLLVNDYYRRFLRPEASAGHYVNAGRVASMLVMGGAVATAFLTESIAKAFEYVITGTAAIGVVAILRWLWWRVNAWAEISAMILSPLMTFVLRDPILWYYEWPATPMWRSPRGGGGGGAPRDPDRPGHPRRRPRTSQGLLPSRASARTRVGADREGVSRGAAGDLARSRGVVLASRAGTRLRDDVGRGGESLRSTAGGRDRRGRGDDRRRRPLVVVAAEGRPGSCARSSPGRLIIPGMGPYPCRLPAGRAKDHPYRSDLGA